MIQLLQPAKLDTQFEYQVNKNGYIYVAGARNCKLSQGRAVWGDLLLDKLDERGTRIWALKLTNPFATETKKQETLSYMFPI